LHHLLDARENADISLGHEGLALKVDAADN
jgi:hypothetical protein